MQEKFNAQIKGYTKKELLVNDRFGFTKEEKILFDSFVSVIMIDDSIPLEESLGEYEEDRIITLQRGNKAYVLIEN